MARPDESSSGRKSLARSMGEAVGHVLSAIRKDPAQVQRVSHRVEVEQRGSVILRRTTIEEIETRPAPRERPAAQPSADQPSAAEPTATDARPATPHARPAATPSRQALPPR